MSEAAFNQCVFINCPFDEAYKPVLNAILFCVIYLGLTPRLATERADSGETRLLKIKALIEGSRYSIHDLSRCQANAAGEHYRLNMPFELGLDYGCRQYCGEGRTEKKFLVLEEQRYRYQAALSDLAGADIECHHGQWKTAIRKVRNWLTSEAGTPAPGAQRIIDSYMDFLGWHLEDQIANGFSEDDIKDIPPRERLTAMATWVAKGKPL